jgi:hypothetical protein
MSRVLQMISAGVICDGKSLVGLLFAHRFMANERG